MTLGASELEAVSRARAQIAYYVDPAGIATVRLAAYDTLAAQVRDRETAAWEAGHAAAHAGDPTTWNPYRDKEN